MELPIPKFDSQNIECNNYQNFKNETWYSNLLIELKNNDKIDSRGAKLIRIFSSQIDPGSIDEIITKEGKITESDIVKICNLSDRKIIGNYSDTFFLFMPFNTIK